MFHLQNTVFLILIFYKYQLFIILTFRLIMFVNNTEWNYLSSMYSYDQEISVYSSADGVITTQPSKFLFYFTKFIFYW